MSDSAAALDPRHWTAARPFKALEAQRGQVTNLLQSVQRVGADAPISLRLSATTAGVLEMPPQSRHMVCLHVGPSLYSTCDRSGRMERRVQEHGEIDVLPAGDRGVWIDEAPTRMFSIGVDPVFFDRVAAQAGVHVDLAPGPLRDPGLEQVGWALKTELEEGESSGRIYMEGLALALCARLIARFGRPRDEACGPALPGPRLRRVKEFIEANLDQDLSLSAIAAIGGASPSHFKVLFRRSTGTPLHQYVIGRRVARARELLEAGDMPITEVAFEVGFAHPSHLARWTKRLLGVTPTELVGHGSAPRRRRA